MDSVEVSILLFLLGYARSAAVCCFASSTRAGSLGLLQVVLGLCTFLLLLFRMRRRIGRSFHLVWGVVCLLFISFLFFALRGGIIKGFSTHVGYCQPKKEVLSGEA